MRPLRSIFTRPTPLATTLVGALAALCLVLVLAACGGEPKIERVDVTWVSLEPSPRWGLYPGYRQEIEFRKRSAYRVDVYSGGKVVTGGTVGDTGHTLAFLPSVGSRDIEAQAPERYNLAIYVTLKDEKGDARRLLALKVERQGDKIWFELPKP